eukprot:TRINITY_DN47335_c0_g4_i1.p1 TRINITY_DN47335_c0_g4~~TRINITY_DN47335_c0_g4_i1.p1  ORF type:complete len:1169 (-),score=321.57 TRINITY_DN47335_c0_g4_i1:251-3757(-)
MAAPGVLPYGAAQGRRQAANAAGAGYPPRLDEDLRALDQRLASLAQRQREQHRKLRGGGRSGESGPREDSPDNLARRISALKVETAEASKRNTELSRFCGEWSSWVRGPCKEGYDVIAQRRSSYLEAAEALLPLWGEVANRETAVAVAGAKAQLEALRVRKLEALKHLEEGQRLGHELREVKNLLHLQQQDLPTLYRALAVDALRPGEDILGAPAAVAAMAACENAAPGMEGRSWWPPPGGTVLSQSPVLHGLGGGGGTTPPMPQPGMEPLQPAAGRGLSVALGTAPEPQGCGESPRQTMMAAGPSSSDVDVKLASAMLAKLLADRERQGEVVSANSASSPGGGFGGFASRSPQPSQLAALGAGAGFPPHPWAAALYGGGAPPPPWMMCPPQATPPMQAPAAGLAMPGGWPWAPPPPWGYQAPAPPAATGAPLQQQDDTAERQQQRQQQQEQQQLQQQMQQQLQQLQEQLKQQQQHQQQQQQHQRNQQLDGFPQQQSMQSQPQQSQPQLPSQQLSQQPSREQQHQQQSPPQAPSATQPQAAAAPPLVTHVASGELPPAAAGAVGVAAAPAAALPVSSMSAELESLPQTPAHAVDMSGDGSNLRPSLEASSPAAPARHVSGSAATSSEHGQPAAAPQVAAPQQPFFPAQPVTPTQPQEVPAAPPAAAVAASAVASASPGQSAALPAAAATAVPLAAKAAQPTPPTLPLAAVKEHVPEAATSKQMSLSQRLHMLLEPIHGAACASTDLRRLLREASKAEPWAAELLDAVEDAEVGDGGTLESLMGELEVSQLLAFSLDLLRRYMDGDGAAADGEEALKLASGPDPLSMWLQSMISTSTDDLKPWQEVVVYVTSLANSPHTRSMPINALEALCKVVAECMLPLPRFRAEQVRRLGDALGRLLKSKMPGSAAPAAKAAAPAPAPPVVGIGGGGSTKPRKDPTGSPTASPASANKPQPQASPFRRPRNAASHGSSLDADTDDDDMLQAHSGFQRRASAGERSTSSAGGSRLGVSAQSAAPWRGGAANNRSNQRSRTSASQLQLDTDSEEEVVRPANRRNSTPATAANAPSAYKQRRAAAAEDSPVSTQGASAGLGKSASGSLPSTATAKAGMSAYAMRKLNAGNSGVSQSPAGTQKKPSTSLLSRIHLDPAWGASRKSVEEDSEDEIAELDGF